MFRVRSLQFEWSFSNSKRDFGMGLSQSSYSCCCSSLAGSVVGVDNPKTSNTVVKH